MFPLGVSMSSLLCMSLSSIMAGLGWSRPALAAACVACCSVLVRTACMVAMVLSRQTLMSPSVLLSHAVHSAVNRSPVPAGVNIYLIFHWSNEVRCLERRNLRHLSVASHSLRPPRFRDKEVWSDISRLTYEGCRELWNLQPDDCLDPVSDAAGETEEELVAAELRAGEDDGGGTAAVQEVHHLPRVLLRPDLPVSKQLRLELVGKTDVGQREDDLPQDIFFTGSNCFDQWRISKNKIWTITRYDDTTKKVYKHKQYSGTNVLFRKQLVKLLSLFKWEHSVPLYRPGEAPLGRTAPAQCLPSRGHTRTPARGWRSWGDQPRWPAWSGSFSIRCSR